MLNMKPLFHLAKYDVFRLFGVFAIAWMIINVVFFMVEKAVWGESFVHWGDVILAVFLGCAFGFCAWEMGKEITVQFSKSDRSSPDTAEARQRAG